MARSEQFIMDEDGTLLRDEVRIGKRWEGFFQPVLHKKSPKRDVTIIALFPQRPLAPLLGDEPTMDCLLYTSPSPRDKRQSRMPSSA